MDEYDKATGRLRTGRLIHTKTYAANAASASELVHELDHDSYIVAHIIGRATSIMGISIEIMDICAKQF